MHNLDPEELLDRLEVSERKRLQLQKSLNQRTVEEEVPLWSMVDLMTLLLVFFLFFYTSTLKDSISEAQDTQEENFIQQQIETLPSLQEEEYSEAIGESENLKEMIVQLQEEVQETVGEGDENVFSVTADQHRLVFVLGERITFEVGEARLLESYHPIFVKIAEFISLKPECSIVVSGHTDDTPIMTAMYPSNMELSSARAINVAKFLIQNGVTPHRVSTQGFSEYQPMVENTSSKNRQANRRVEIALIEEQKQGQI